MPLYSQKLCGGFCQLHSRQTADIQQKDSGIKREEYGKSCTGIAV